MTDVNRAVLTGRLTDYPDVRKTQSGKSVCSFTLGVNRRKDETAFISCVAWNQSADFLGQFAQKGDLINVDGHITTRKYEREGRNVYVTEVVADSVGLMLKKNSTQSQTAPQKPQNEPTEPVGISITEDDLPF